MSSPCAAAIFWRSSISDKRAQKVAVRRGLLEAFGVGSLHHAGFEAFHQVVAAALQEQFRVARRFRIFLVRGQTRNARPVAAANVILQAGPRVRARQVHRAGGNAKRFVDEVDDPVGKAVRKERPEINRAVFDQAPRHVHARKFLERGVANVRVGLVVAQQDIEFRLVLLDQAVFERQGFALVVHDDVVEIRDFPHQGAGFGVHPAGFEEVGFHAVAQGTRFPHVQNVPQRVLEQIDARLGGKAGGFLIEFHCRSRMRGAAIRSRATPMIAK